MNGHMRGRRRRFSRQQHDVGEDNRAHGPRTVTVAPGRAAALEWLRSAEGRSWLADLLHAVFCVDITHECPGRKADEGTAHRMADEIRGHLG